MPGITVSDVATLFACQTLLFGPAAGPLETVVIQSINETTRVVTLTADQLQRGGYGIELATAFLELRTMLTRRGPMLTLSLMSVVRIASASALGFVDFARL